MKKIRLIEKQDGRTRQKGGAKMNAIVIDIETTGLEEDDEILQVSIIDFNGNVLFNEYIKPTRKKQWTEAQRINGISPEMVNDCKTFSCYKNQIQEIFDSTDLIIGYNYNFDLWFLERKKIVAPDCEYFNMMEEFACVYGEWNDYFNDYQWQGLIKCAQFYHYAWEQSARNALEKCRATLYCYKKMMKITTE